MDLSTHIITWGSTFVWSWSVGLEEAKVYLSLVLQHLGSSNASGLLHDAKSLNPMRSNLCAVGQWVPHLPWPPRSVFRKGWWYHQGNWGLGASGDYYGTDHSEQTGPDAGVPFAFAQKSPQGTTQNRKKQKNIKYSKNITFYKIVNMAWQMWHQSLTRQLPGTFRVILETVHTLGCKGKHFKIYSGKHRS